MDVLLLDDCGAPIPSFIHISDASCTTFMPRYAGSRSHLRVGSWVDFARLYVRIAPSRGLLRHSCQVEHRCSSRLFGADGLLDRHLTTRPMPWSTRQVFETSAAHPLQGRRVSARRWSSSPTTDQPKVRPPRAQSAALQKPLAGGLLQVDQAASIGASSRHVGERGEDADLDCRTRSTPRRHRQKRSRPGASSTRLQIISVTGTSSDNAQQNTCGDENRCFAAK